MKKKKVKPDTPKTIAKKMEILDKVMEAIKKVFGPQNKT